MQHREADIEMGYVDRFYARVAEQVANDVGTLWVREIREGFVEYAVPRLLQWAEDENVREIKLGIIGGGGSVDDALAVYSTLRSIDTSTVAVIYAAESAGVLVALGCDTRIGFPTSTVLIHDIYWGYSGRGDLLDDYNNALLISRRVIDGILLSRTSLTPEQLEANRRREWWMGAEEALKAGIFTEIAGLTVADDRPKRYR